MHTGLTHTHTHHAAVPCVLHNQLTFSLMLFLCHFCLRLCFSHSCRTRICLDIIHTAPRLRNSTKNSFEEYAKISVASWLHLLHSRRGNISQIPAASWLMIMAKYYGHVLLCKFHTLPGLSSAMLRISATLGPLNHLAITQLNRSQ